MTPLPGQLPELSSVLPRGVIAGFLGRSRLIDTIYDNATDREQATIQTAQRLAQQLAAGTQNIGKRHLTIAPILRKHTGGIWTLTADGHMKTADQQCANYDLQICVPCRVGQNLSRPDGDAIVIEQLSAVTSIFNYASIIMGVADCVVAVISTDDGNLAMAHLSNQTEFGWNTTANANSIDSTPPFQGSLLRRVFEQMPAKRSRVWLMPHIGAGGCWCYEYNETLDYPDGTILERCIHREHPKVPMDGLWQERPRVGKRDIRWGELFVRILESLGVRRDRIHSSGECTVCHSDRYYSYRSSRNLPKLHPHRRNLAWLTIRQPVRHRS